MDDYPVDLIVKGAVHFVFTTHVTHQQQFFVHVESRSKILEDIMYKLATRYTDLELKDKPLHNKRLGSLCAARFTDDNNWYRAKITGLMKNGLIEVQFVDYGNVDYVSDDRVKAIDADLIMYPVQCYRCSLANVSSDQGFWTPESIIQFEDRVIDKRCRAVFIDDDDENDEVYQLQMYDEEDNNINQLFGAVAIVDAHTEQNGVDRCEGFKEEVLKIGTEFQATVVYVNSPELFWCQNTEYVNDILIMSEELSRLHMTQDIKPLKSVSKGTVCAAKSIDDEAWYRGIVESVSGHSATVLFVDYGNTDTVNLDVVCQLKAEMRMLPILGIKCCLVNVQKRGREWNEEVVKKFEQLTVDREFEVKVVGIDGDVYMVTLLDIVENKDVGIQLQSVMDSLKSVTSVQDINTNKQPSNVTSGIGPSFDVGSKVDVFLSWIENPGDFWIQLSNAEDLLEELSQQLQEVYNQQQPLARASPGAFVVARFSQDKNWYRSLVLKDVEDGYVQVLFIDYGNTDTLPVTELRQVTAAFGKVIPLASRCCLVGVKPLQKGDKSWTNDARDLLEKLSENGCQCEVLDETHSHKLVKLHVGSQDVAEELLAMGMVAISDSKPHCPSFLHETSVNKSEREEVVVTHIESPKSFWCQLRKNIPALYDLTKKMSLRYTDNSGTSLNNPTVGQACIVQYSPSNMWQRATITKVVPSGYVVHFVDYGNVELVPKDAVYVPEHRFLDLPKQAFHCALPVTEDGVHLTDIFKQTALKKELHMQVLDLLNGIAIVELFHGKMQVSEHLKSISYVAPVEHAVSVVDFEPARNIPLGSTVHMFASFVYSPSKFFVQISGIDTQLDALMDSITQLYVSRSPPPSVTSPYTGQACIALYSEDDQWYRARVTDVKGSKCTVMFVDYGNEDNVEIENIRVVTPDIARVPIMAYQCSLHGVVEAVWSEAAIHFFDSLITDKKLDCTFVTLSSVRVSCGGHVVADQLVQAGHCKANVSKQGIRSKETEAVSEFARDPGQRKTDLVGADSARREVREKSHVGGGHGDRDSARRLEVGHKNEDTNSFGGRERGVGGGFNGGKDERYSKVDGTSGKDSRFSEDSHSRFGGRDNKTNSDSTVSDDFPPAEVPSEQVTAILVHMDESGIFYLQLPLMEKEILFLSKRIAGSYKGGSGPRLKETPTKGTICCAKFPDDGNMYRARIEDIQGSTAILRYVDYGNTGECYFGDLKFLFADLVQYPVQAFPCRLRGLKWSLDQVEKFARATLDKDLKVTFTNTTSPFEVDILTGDGDLLEILTNTATSPALKLSTKPSAASASSGSGSKFQSTGLKADSNTHHLEKSGTNTAKIAGDQALISDQSVPKQKFASLSPPVDTNLAAFICHIGQDGYFYLQLARDTATIESISQQLLSLPDNIKHTSLSKGASCAAVFSEDAVWYRALITDIIGDSLSVVFVDYGNQDSVSAGSVKPLPSQLLSHSPLAYQCQFLNLGEPLPPDAQFKLAEYLMEHQVTVTFSGTSPPFDVSITTADGENLQEIVCPSKQYRSQCIPSEATPACVTHIEEDGRFFLQLYQDNQTAKDMHEDLQLACEAGAAECTESLEVGMPCCLKVVENATWQRSKLVERSDQQVHVYLVDTGRTITTDVKCLRSLPSKFLKKPPFAFECRLKSVVSWDGDLHAKFTDMTQDKVLNATFSSKTPPFIVSLARSIEFDLLGLSGPADMPSQRHPSSSSSDLTPETKELPHQVSTETKELPHQVSTETKELPHQVSTETKELPHQVSTETKELLHQVSTETKELLHQVSTETKELLHQVSTETKELLHQVSTETKELPTVSTDTKYGNRTVYISHIESNGLFYTQPVDTDLADIADSLETLLSTSSSLSQEVGVGDVVCAMFTEDDCWYRAQIESCHSDSRYSVRFLDYGNSDLVGRDRLAALPESLDLSLVPAYAVKCRLYGISGDLTTQQSDKLREAVQDQMVKVAYRREIDGVHEVDLCLGGVNIIQTLELLTGSISSDLIMTDMDSEKESTCSEACRNEEQFDVVPDTPAATIRDGMDTMKSNNSVLEVVSTDVAQVDDVASIHRAAASISYVYSPDRFYIQLEDSKAGLNEMMDTIYEHLSSLPEHVEPVPAWKIGDVCAALYEDESWYRVKIESLTDDGSVGTIFYIDYGNTESVELASLRQLPEKLTSVSPFALQAKLAGVSPQEESWTEEALQEFKNMVENKCVLADILEVNNAGLDCVVHLLCLGIHVHEELIRKGHAVAGRDIAVSTCVQHFFSDNESSCVETKTEEYSPCLESTHLEGDSETAQETMITHVTNVDLKLGCVSSSLKELEEIDVFVSHTVSPSHFWCQLSSSSDVLSDINHSMATIYNSKPAGNKVRDSLHLGDVVVAVYSDDGELYRARVVNVHSAVGVESTPKTVVRFVDYGNESEVSNSQVFEMDASLCRWPAQAFSCCLDKVQPLDETWSLEACLKFSEIVTGQQLLLKMVGREQDGGTVLVELVVKETSQSVNSAMLNSGLAKVTLSQTRTPMSEMKTMDISEIESLEMTQPIMESTASVVDVTQDRVRTFIYEAADDRQFKSVRLSMHTEYDVVVSNNELPNAFHVQLVELRDQYMSLMSEIADHVASDCSQDQPTFLPDPGHVCLVKHCGLWYRGQVTAKDDSSSWNVESVDCGWVVQVSSKELRPLPSRLRHLPAQAVPCCLAGIVSVESEWTLEAITFFIECIQDAQLCMYILENTDDGKCGVYLSDLNTSSFQSINRAMVELGYAEVVSGSNIEVQIEMEKTLDTDGLEDLEKSFNEVSQFKCNGRNDLNMKVIATSTLSSDNPLLQPASEGDCEMFNTEADQSHISRTDVVGEPQSENQALRTDDAQISKIEFNCALAVDRIDEMGCIENYSEGCLSIDLEDTESGEDSNITDRSDKMMRQEISPVECVETCSRQIVAATASNTDVDLVALCSEENVHTRVQVQDFTEGSTHLTAQDICRKLCNKETWEEEEQEKQSRNRDVVCCEQQRLELTFAKQQKVDDSTMVRVSSHDDGCAFIYPSQERSLLTNLGERPNVIRQLSIDAPFEIAKADSICEPSSIETSTEEYQSYCEISSQDLEETNRSMNSFLTLYSSHEPHESSYDTSSLVFSDIFGDDSQTDISNSYLVLSTEASTLESDDDGISQNSFAGNNSSSTDVQDRSSVSSCKIDASSSSPSNDKSMAESLTECSREFALLSSTSCSIVNPSGQAAMGVFTCDSLPDDMFATEDGTSDRSKIVELETKNVRESDMTVSLSCLSDPLTNRVLSLQESISKVTDFCEGRSIRFVRSRDPDRNMCLQGLSSTAHPQLIDVMGQGVEDVTRFEKHIQETMLEHNVDSDLLHGMWRSDSHKDHIQHILAGMERTRKEELNCEDVTTIITTEEPPPPTSYHQSNIDDTTSVFSERIKDDDQVPDAKGDACHDKCEHLEDVDTPVSTV